jgi:hypothetical protein
MSIAHVTEQPPYQLHRSAIEIKTKEKENICYHQPKDETLLLHPDPGFA